MSAAPKLYQPDVRCPRCGAPPRVRVTRRQVDKWAQDNPRELVQTYQCSFERFPGRKCGTIYGISAGAIQRAREVGGVGAVRSHDIQG